MARLDALPDEKTIRAFIGVIDFATWKGIPYARRWPRPGVQPRSQPQEYHWAHLRDANVQARQLNANLKPDLDYQVSTGVWTWRDHHLSQYFGGFVHPLTFNALAHSHPVPNPPKGGIDPFSFAFGLGARGAPPTYGPPPHSTVIPHPDPFKHFFAVRSVGPILLDDHQRYIQYSCSESLHYLLYVQTRTPTHQMMTRERRGFVYDTAPSWSPISLSNVISPEPNYPLSGPTFDMNPWIQAHPMSYLYIQLVGRLEVNGHVSLSSHPPYAWFTGPWDPAGPFTFPHSPRAIQHFGPNFGAPRGYPMPPPTDPYFIPPP